MDTLRAKVFKHSMGARDIITFFRYCSVSRLPNQFPSYRTSHLARGRFPDPGRKRKDCLSRYGTTRGGKSHESHCGQIVERRAANLILACIADDIARRSGWSTATDRDIEFYFNGLSRLERPAETAAAQAFFATAVISSQVPSNILSMPWKRYETIRNAYADLRRPLEDLFSD